MPADLSGLAILAGIARPGRFAAGSGLSIKFLLSLPSCLLCPVSQNKGFTEAAELASAFEPLLDRTL
jgi:hypothetical protein